MERRVVRIKDTEFGSGKFEIIAGPCAIESKEQLLEVVKVLKENNVKIMRASAYKPRTKPNSFQGLEEKGLEILDEVRKETGIITESEITSTEQIDFAKEKVDILRVGARNMQNYELLKKLSKIENPIILKNGLASTIDEFLGAAEYLTQNGKENVILCWRGIRTFETETRFTADILTIPILKEKTDLPVIADVSHPAGKKELVLPLAKAFAVAGADGIMVETHPNPKEAKSDKEQQIPLDEFPNFLKEIRKASELA